MIHVITLLVALVIDATILITMYSKYGVGSGAFLSVSVGSLLIFIIWASIVIDCIRGAVEKQVEDFEALTHIDELKDALVEEYRTDKIANEEALEKYKNEAKTALVDNYKNFEENLMDKIHDSKLVAMVLRKSGYADVLNEYHKRIVSLTNKIRECDTGINYAIKDAKKDKTDCIKRMLVRQGQGIFGYYYFFPKHSIYKQSVRDK